MEKTKYKIDIPGNGKEIIPFSAEFQRINIVLGGNGTGKSKILNQLKSHVNSFGFARQLICVEGGRTMTIPDSLQLDQRNFNQYRTFQQTENSYKSKRQATISQRIKDALILLEQKEQEINNTFAKEAHDWDLNGRINSFPLKPQAPLERLFDIFNEVFPSITLKFISAQKSLRCYKNGNEYSPSQLSDGEKQIFCLLADIFMLTEPGSLIIVDEPELNLNPGLACRFWDILENELPESIFIYATHCVSFAMRRHVDYVVVLSKTLGCVTTIEINEKFHSRAELNQYEYLSACRKQKITPEGAIENIKFIHGDAKVYLPKLIPLADKIDMIFLDGDKENYQFYLDWAIKNLRSGGYLLIDNALFKGSVVSGDGVYANSIRNMTKNLKSSGLFDYFFLPVGDCMIVAKKR